MQGFVALPEDVKVGLVAVVLWLISYLFTQLITLVPFLKFLDEFRAPLAMAISAALIGWFENVVPDAFGGVAVIGVQLLLAILALFGVGNQLKAKNVKLFGRQLF